MKNLQKLDLGRCFKTEDGAGAAAGGAAGAAAAPAGLQPEPIVQDSDTITIPDNLVPDLTIQDGASEGDASAAGADAGGAPAAEPRFAVVNGQKIQLAEDGTIPEEALANAVKGKFVPESTFHREVQKARAGSQEPSGRAAAGGQVPPAKKIIEPFKRADNNIDPSEDLPGYLKFEREQDALERDHSRKSYDSRIDELNAALTQERSAREHAELRGEFSQEFEEAAAASSVYAGDHPKRKAIRDMLFDIVSQDKRHEYNPHVDSAGREIPGLESMTTNELVSKYWSIIKGAIDHEVESITKKSTKLSGEVATVSPHKGGAVSIAAKPAAQPRNDAGKFVPSPLKPGEKAGDGIVRDAIRLAGQRK